VNDGAKNDQPGSTSIELEGAKFTAEPAKGLTAHGGSVRHDALIDSGCTKTVVGSMTLPQHYHKLLRNSYTVTYNTASSPLHSHHDACIPLHLFHEPKGSERRRDLKEFNSEFFWIKTRVVEGKTPLLLQHTALTSLGHDGRTGKSYGWESPVTRKKLKLAEGASLALPNVFLTQKELTLLLSQLPFNPHQGSQVLTLVNL